MGRIVPTRRPVVLVVDDMAVNRELLEGYLYDLGYAVRQAADGIEALASIAEVEPDVIVLDLLMPRMDGLELCRRLKSDPARRLIPIIVLTALQERETLIKAIEAGADDFLTKPFDAKELLVRTKGLIRSRQLTKELDASHDVVLAFGRVVEAHDMYTERHAERVGLVARALGQAAGLADEADLECLYNGGVLHDVGKVIVPAAILTKKGPLDEQEWVVVRMHSTEGERICRPLRSVVHYLPIIRHHHERWDGAGYPDHLRGTDIPLCARIAAVADAFDAMRSDRAYRAALSIDETVQRLTEGAGAQWDPELIESFIALVERRALPADVLGGAPALVTA